MDDDHMDKLPRRKNIRLQNYDYSQAGYYFITICTQDKQRLFGEIADGKLSLNVGGEMIKKWIYRLESKFPQILIDKYIVMPNHVHCIMANKGMDWSVYSQDNGLENVGADPCVCPQNNNLKYKKGEYINLSLSQIIQWFKTMTTNEYIQGVKNGVYPVFNKRIWQRNYYDRVIRNEQEYKKIYEYIETNPLQWEDDEYYIK